MKNLKKVLAMVLAFACTFSMFAGAKVFEDVPAGSDYSEAITMLSDLGVIQGKDDGKYHPEDTITRAEACAMIARLMTGDPKVSQYVGAQSFSDVQKGSWKDSAIGYCYINGIVIGVGNNKFEPDRAITDAEFVTMVVRAMGYETADMKQNYPFSYMSNAQAMGLLDGTNMVASTDALRGEDAQVIYNALFADYARGAKLVNTTHGTSVESYPTLAESVWGLQRAAVGTWDKDNKDDEKATLTNCKAHTWVVVGADKKNEGNILAYPIEDDETDVYASEKNKYVPYSFKYEGDIEAIKGYQVELWGEGKHGEPTWEKGEGKFVYSDNWTIKAIKTVKGQKAYDYNASMADKKDDNGEIVLGEETLKLESVADNAKELSKENTTKTNLTTYLTKDEYNGEKIGDKKNVEKALNVRTGAQYKLVDWDSDGDIDWVVVDQASYFKVESVNSKRLTVSAMEADKKLDSDKDDKSVTWKLDDLNDEKDYKVKYEVPEGLEEGDVIELTYKVAYDKGEKCEVITATATKVEADNAELDKVSTKDDLELTFDGEVSKIAQNAAFGDIIDPANPDKYADFDDEELGTEFALWKNRNGFIVYSDYVTESSNYMMVLDTGDGSDKTGDRKEAKADILLADNSVKKDVKFATDLKIDGKNNGTTGYDKDTREWDETKVVGNVYKYWADEDGKITKMEAAIDVKDAAKDDNYTYDESSDRLKADSSFVASLEGADVIFAVTKNYIEGTSDLSVDDANVLAVKKNDIPDIALGSNDTKTAQLAANNQTWLDNEYQNHFIANVDKNGEASAAILGVENFNKFDAAATTVGLVTSVSYDKSDVVEIEVAYNGEVTTLKSAEKVDFDDIVEAYDQSAKKDLSLSSPKDQVNNALFNNEKLSDYLKKNGAYAEITVDADGKLTAVTFMDKAGDNKVTGHYYEVSRRIITDVKDGNVAYGNAASYYYNDKNLYSVDRLPVTDTDLAKDVKYYSINGRPEINGKDSDDYKGVLLSVVNGFDGTPDIKAESDSTLVESFVNNKFDDADTYEIADLACKIDGDIVAAFAFEDSLGETDKKADSVVVDVDKNAAKAVPNDGADHDIADVKSAQGGGNVTADVKVYKDGKEVSDVTAKLDSKDLKVNAQKGAATGDYVAKFTVDKTTYEVKFTVTTADVAVPDFSETHENGVNKVDEVKASIEIDLASSSVTADQNLDVQINGVDVVATSSTNTTDAYATALAAAINDSTLGFDVKASASASKVTVTANDDTVKAFTVKAKTSATGITVTTDNAKKYSAPVEATSAVAELTFKSGVNKASEITVTVGDASANVTLNAGDTAEQIAAKVAAASFTGYTVKADGAKVIFTSTATGAGATISGVNVAAKA
ncbi:S-layer homology domain-containing protein [Butyricicoccus pullicaecorum]|uniref:S-layer homology domain-containing protein n=1 Tax=Butyricicoccus pullicaecorum TaxID=501571 RepID=UPI00352203EC